MLMPSNLPESPNWKSRLIDALTLLSSSASASCLIDREMTLLTLPPQVPAIVLAAIEHLELHGKQNSLIIKLLLTIDCQNSEKLDVLDHI